MLILLLADSQKLLMDLPSVMQLLTAHTFLCTLWPLNDQPEGLFSIMLQAVVGHHAHFMHVNIN